MLSATATREILKLPLLVIHYYDHLKKKNSGVLVSFLIMHYCIKEGTDTDAAENNHLLLKPEKQEETFSFTSETPPAITGALAKPENECNQSFTIHSELFLPSQYSAAIWQPPRYC